MDKRLYCESCALTKETGIRTVTKRWTHKSKTVTVKADERYCTTCNSAVYDEPLDQAFIKTAIETYNVQYGMPGRKIHEFRKKLGLTQHELALLTGISRKTLISYEKESAIPEASNASLLKLLINEPACLYELAEEKSLYTTSPKIKILLQDHKTKQSEVLNEYNGYTKLQHEKINNIILFFAQSKTSMTKLNKGLFYVDFNYFRNHTVSLTGLQYVHQTYGPFTPTLYEQVHALQEEGDLQVETFEHPSNGQTYHLYTATKPFDVVKYFDQETAILLQAVREYLQQNNAESISEDSHKETAWLKTCLLEPISYHHAQDLKIVF